MASKCQVEITYILIPDEVNGMVLDSMRSFASLINIPTRSVKPHRVNKKKAQQVENFSDEEQVEKPTDDSLLTDQ